MATGKVKWFNSTRGFGMIERITGEEVFVHASSILWDAIFGITHGAGPARALEAGQEVQFELFATARGMEARKVRGR